MLIPQLYIPLFRRKIKSFHFFGVLGYILGGVLGIIISMQMNLQPNIVLLMAAVGAITFFLLVYISKWVAGEEIIVYYHHEITILIMCTLALYLSNKPILIYLDIALLGIGVFLGFGRIGCYFVGCCHGRPHKHGVKYGQQHVDAGFTWFYKDIPLLPVQLMESAYVFLIVISGIILLLNNAIPGTVLIVYTVLYGLMRFVLEFFRGDPGRPMLHGVSEAQWTTVLLTSVTFGLSKLGWLPAYNWHWMILILMLVACLVTIYQFNRIPEQILFNPPNIGELAEALKILEEVNADPVSKQKYKIKIYTTRAGLSLSCSNGKGPKNIKHYTISLKNKIIRQPSAHKIAQIISAFKNLPGKYELIEKQNGIYHILFINTEQNLYKGSPSN